MTTRRRRTNNSCPSAKQATSAPPRPIARLSLPISGAAAGEAGGLSSMLRPCPGEGQRTYLPLAGDDGSVHTPPAPLYVAEEARLAAEATRMAAQRNYKGRGVHGPWWRACTPRAPWSTFAISLFCRHGRREHIPPIDGAHEHLPHDNLGELSLASICCPSNKNTRIKQPRTLC